MPTTLRHSKHLRNVLRDKRGATSLAFIGFATAFIGIAGFGIEGSTWYLERRHGQNAADAAAIAGVLALVQTPTSYSGAISAGTNVATDDGYTNGTNNTTVSVQAGTYSGGFTASSTSTCTTAVPCTAVQAQITRAETHYLSSLLLGSGSTNVQETAVAVIAATGPACSLALGGGLGFSGSAAVTGNNCSLASNRKDAQSITFNGAGSNKTQANAILVGAGGCTESGSGTPCAQSGNLMYQPPTTDPYVALQTDASAIPSSVNSTNCSSSTSATSPYVINATNHVYCVGSDLTINNSKTTVALTSGTYFFYNSSLNISGGTLTCAGCTFIFTGSSASSLGKIKITGGTVTLSAAKNNLYDTNYNGILFYMDYRYAEQNAGVCGIGNVWNNIQGSSTVTLNGGMYFPNASVCVTGNAFSGTESCLSLVGWSIYYNGNATETLSGCGTYGTNTAQVRAIQLVL